MSEKKDHAGAVGWIVGFVVGGVAGSAWVYLATQYWSDIENLASAAPVAGVLAGRLAGGLARDWVRGAAGVEDEPAPRRLSEWCRAPRWQCGECPGFLRASWRDPRPAAGLPPEALGETRCECECHLASWPLPPS